MSNKLSIKPTTITESASSPAVTPTNSDKKSIWNFNMIKSTSSRRSMDIQNLEKQYSPSSPGGGHLQFSNLSNDNNRSSSHIKFICGNEPIPLTGPPEIISKCENVAIPVGSVAILSCQLKHHDGSIVTWTKSEPNATPINNMIKYNWFVTTKGEARLIVNGAVPSDSGVYICSVSNRHGTTQCSIGLTVLSSTVTDTSSWIIDDDPVSNGTVISAELINPTSVRISWDFTSATTNSYIIEYSRIGITQWFRNDDKPVRSRYIMTGLTPGESYVFRLLCINTNVTSLPSAPVTMPLSENHMWQQQQFNHRYSVLSELGRGRFSVVRLAADATTGQYVALKQISRKYQDAITTQEEYKLMASTQHPNIVHALAFFENAPSNGFDTIVMEL